MESTEQTDLKTLELEALELEALERVESILPNNFRNYDFDTQRKIIQFIEQLNPIEAHAYKIGKSHLGTSYNIVKSNGFVEWNKKQNKTK
jgi:hypothetical protein